MTEKKDKKIYKIDAADKILGRLAVQVANLLRGKNKPSFEYYKSCGDEVVVTNTDKIRLSGRKEDQKIYYSHSGYPGGLKERKFKTAMVVDSRQVVRKAIYGMLPKNRLRDQIIKKLTLYKKEEK